jgi:subtilisin family serine protease
MPRVKGKEQLCSCDRKYFKSTQGLDGHSLFERYPDIENVVSKKVDKIYQHFLAQPVINEDTIIWFSKTFNETPRRFTELQGEDLAKYGIVKKNTIANYKKNIEILKNEGQYSEAETLENAIKFINDDFVYCYDGIVVLGIWGMQLREKLRESTGAICKSKFKEKNKPTPIPPIIEEPSETEVEITEDPIENHFTIRFIAGDNGNILGDTEFQKYSGEIIDESEIPIIEPKAGYKFAGWDKDPIGYDVTNETTFIAQYIPIVVPPIIRLPWYKRFWDWLKNLFIGRGCLKWLLWFLLLLLLIFLLICLFRGCGNDLAQPIPSPIDDKPWVKDDPRVSDGGGIYDPGNPYEKVPTPPEYDEVLPPNQGEMPTIDTTKIIREPGQPVIVSNRLNILLEDEDKSIMDLAKEFKAKYPDEKYKVVYYDDIVKRMQIEVPPEERLKLKTEIPEKFAPTYELFVFDESLFESSYTPNDPAFSSSDKSWYLKTINAPNAWDITKGSPKITIAVVDNGFSLKHPELQSKVVMPYNVWLHSKEIFAQSIDHGTHVAGTALAMMDNKSGLCGIAPNCAFMPVQVANQEGMMTTTSILDGILYALYQGADVINVSLGMQFFGALPESEQLNLQNNHFKEEERLWNKVMEISDKHKTIIVIAAGNENMLAGVNPMSRPKNFIVVSAVDKSNREYQKAGFSNYGDFSTVSAPGVAIYSTVGNNDYQVMNGTSMAAPIVSGTVALMKSLNDSLTAEQIVCVLQGTGKQTEGKVGNLIQLDKALLKVKSTEFVDCNSQRDKPSTGDVQILLNWENYNDLDIICVDPNGDKIWYENKKVASGGQLEIDMNVKYPDSKSPLENIFWPLGKAPNGKYMVFLKYFKKHIQQNETLYQITIKFGGETETFTGILKENEIKPICSFKLGEVMPTKNRRDELIREKEALQRKLEQINGELNENKIN